MRAHGLCSAPDGGSASTSCEAEFPDRVAAVTMDVRVPADSQRLVSTALERFGRLDALVANTGIGMYGGILDNSDEALAAMLDTNIAGTVWPSVPPFRT